MLRILTLVLLAVLVGCASNRTAAPLRSGSLTPAQTERVEVLIEALYRSFGHGEGEEPDWKLMRSVFVDGAQFVGEAPAGGSPKPQTVDAFISSWQASIRSSAARRPAQAERITGTRITTVGRLVRVDVAFQAKKSNDPAPRKPGLDSLLLTEVAGVWKVLSFVVHFESKLPESGGGT